MTSDPGRQDDQAPPAAATRQGWGRGKRGGLERGGRIKPHSNLAAIEGCVTSGPGQTGRPGTPGCRQETGGGGGGWWGELGGNEG